MQEPTADPGGGPLPRLNDIVPVLGIASYDAAISHYIDWLGFTVDWEWREAPGKPVVMSISRDEISLMLCEGSAAQGSWLTIRATNLDAFADELNTRRPHSVEVTIGPPYDLPELHVVDECGNRLVFGEELSAEESALREARRVSMREYIRRRIADDAGRPSPDDIVNKVGGPVGLAVEVLSEFPEVTRAGTDRSPRSRQRRS